MKILMVNWSWYPTGGDWTYIHNVKQLYEQNGHEVIPLSTQNSKNVPSNYPDYFVKVDDFKVLNQKKSIRNAIKVVKNSIISYDALRVLDQILDEHDITIAHLHNIHHYISPAIIWKLKKKGIKVIWTLHDYKIICPENSFVTHNQICERCITGNFYNCTTYKCKKNSLAASFLASVDAYFYHGKRIYDKVDAYLCPSQFLLNKFKQGGFGDTLHHLPNCYDVSAIDDFITQNESSPYLQAGYILYVGRMESIKGVKTLLDAVKGTNIHLKLAGGGTTVDEFISYARENGIHNAEFVGFMDKAAIFELTYNARFVVCPSEWYENLPFSIVESLLFSKPVIGANIGGIPELVVHGYTGYLFEPGNAADLRQKIMDLWNNTEILELISKNCRKYVENLVNFEKHWQNLEIIINKVLEK